MGCSWDGWCLVYRQSVLSWLVNFCQMLKSLKISTGCILLWLGLVWMHPGKSGKWRARGNRKELGGGNRKEDMDRNQRWAGSSCYLVEDIDTALVEVERILTLREDVDALSLALTTSKIQIQIYPVQNQNNPKKDAWKRHMYPLNQMVTEGDRCICTHGADRFNVSKGRKSLLIICELYMCCSNTIQDHTDCKLIQTHYRYKYKHCEICEKIMLFKLWQQNIWSWSYLFY